MDPGCRHLKRFKARSASRELARKVFSFIFPVYVWFLDMSGYTAIYRIQDNYRIHSQIFLPLPIQDPSLKTGVNDGGSWGIQGDPGGAGGSWGILEDPDNWI